jgi:hypothetical protein
MTAAREGAGVDGSRSDAPHPCALPPRPG